MAGILDNIDHLSREKWLHVIQYPGYDTYISPEQANQLCDVRHDRSLKSLQTRPLSAATLKTNNTNYTLAVHLANEVIRVYQRVMSPFIQIDIHTFDFWASVVEHAKGKITTGLLHYGLRGPDVAKLIASHWKMMISDVYGRIGTREALTLYHVVQLKELPNYGLAQTIPLDKVTITIDALARLCMHIHGKTPG